MTQKFAQKSNVPLAIGFAGLILISQLMVFNMGYQVPWYFLAILGFFTAMIVWGFLGNDIIFEDKRLVIMSGPFKNTIPFDAITSLSPGKKGLLKNARADHQLIIHYGKGKRFVLFPKDRAAFLQTFSKQIPRIEIPEELKAST